MVKNEKNDEQIKLLQQKVKNNKACIEKNEGIKAENGGTKSMKITVTSKKELKKIFITNVSVISKIRR